VKIWPVIFWLLAQCNLVGGYQRFGGTYCLQFYAENGRKTFLLNAGVQAEDATTQNTITKPDIFLLAAAVGIKPGTL
jgi:hypothetical protein